MDFSLDAGLHNLFRFFPYTLPLTFLLSFVVVNLWQTFTEAERNASKEAETLHFIHGLFSHYGARDVVAAVEEYVDSIVREEWPAMAEGKTSPATQEKRGRVIGVLETVPVVAERAGDSRSSSSRSRAPSNSGRTG